MSRKPKPEKNVFIARARAVERAEHEQAAADMLAAEGMVPIDVTNLPKIHSSKPSPARSPSAGRAAAMAAQARQRKTQAFVDKKRLQRATREEAQDHE